MQSSGHKVFNIILAVLIAIIGWTFVVYNYDPDTDVRYNDVNIIYIGEDILAAQQVNISNPLFRTVIAHQLFLIGLDWRYLLICRERAFYH